MSDLHVRDIGDGPAVVLLHAFPCDGRMWEPVAADLAADGYRVLVPDLPGFGRSPSLGGEPDLDAVADAVVDLLADRRIDRCVLGGVSLGGYVAMALLRERADLVSAVMLCDTKATADAPEARQNRERLAAMCLAEPDGTGRILAQAVLPGLLSDASRQSRPEVVARVGGWLDEASADAVAWYQRAMAARPDSLLVLAGLRVPILVLWGEDDELSPLAEQELMTACVAFPESVVVPQAGHLANVERPDEVAAAMKAFLASLTRA